jgi:hypothetical protein
MGVLRGGLVVHHFDYWNPARLAEQIAESRTG